MMKYAEYLDRTSFSKDELIAHTKGRLVEDPPDDFVKLPSPPLLLVSRITEIEKRGNRGRMVAELDIAIDDWYFQAHFDGDPIQPGVFGLDAVFQLMGFYCSLNGAVGRGRALGCTEVDFFGGIRPHDKLVTYDIKVKRCTQLQSTGVTVAIGDAEVSVDGDVIYTFKNVRTGTFTGIAYPNYPWPHENATGGIMQRNQSDDA